MSSLSASPQLLSTMNIHHYKFGTIENHHYHRVADFPPLAKPWRWLIRDTLLRGWRVPKWRVWEQRCFPPFMETSWHWHNCVKRCHPTKCQIFCSLYYIYIYTGGPAFRNITALEKETAHVWASSNTEGQHANAWWGRGDNSVPKLPDQWQTQMELLNSNFRNMMRRDRVNYGEEYVRKVYRPTSFFLRSFVDRPRECLWDFMETNARHGSSWQGARHKPQWQGVSEWSKWVSASSVFTVLTDQVNQLSIREINHQIANGWMNDNDLTYYLLFSRLMNHFKNRQHEWDTFKVKRSDYLVHQWVSAHTDWGTSVHTCTASTTTLTAFSA